jgi:hypothetical protein
MLRLVECHMFRTPIASRIQVQWSDDHGQGYWSGRRSSSRTRAQRREPCRRCGVTVTNESNREMRSLWWGNHENYFYKWTLRDFFFENGSKARRQGHQRRGQWLGARPLSAEPPPCQRRAGAYCLRGRELDPRPLNAELQTSAPRSEHLTAAEP